jgi:hypothetical protein
MAKDNLFGFKIVFDELDHLQIRALVNQSILCQDFYSL